MFLTMELSGPRVQVAKIAFIDAFDRIEQFVEEQINAEPLRLPQTLPEALRELADSEREKEKLIDLDEIKEKLN